MSGLRGTGKTVLMGEFNRICIENGFLPIKRLQFSNKHNDPVEFINALKFDIRSSISVFSKLNFVKDKVKTGLSYIKPKSVGFSDIFYYEPSYESTSKTPVEDHLKDYLSKNWKIFAKSDFKGVILLYDEFHTIHDVPNKKRFMLSDFMGVLNEVQNEGCKYFVVFSGLPNLQLNIKKARSYSERMYKIIEVRNLAEDETRLAISTPLKNSPYKFEKSLVDKLVVETGQYPFFIQFYCNEIINNIEKKKITLKDYEQIKHIIVKQLDDQFYSSRIEFLSDDEKALIFAMAKIEGKNINFNLISSKTGIKMGNLGKYLTRLEQKGLIYNYKRGVYRFSLPLLRDYLLRNIE